MGREAACMVTVDGRCVEGRALLESDAIVLRGGYPLRLARSDILSAQVQGEKLVVTTSRQVTALTLGVAEAARWAATLANPRTRLDKLGINPGTKVFISSVDDGDIDRELMEIRARSVGADSADVLLIGLSSREDLARIGKWARVMPELAHLWILRPKGKHAPVSEADVMATGRAAGLRLSKSLSFSETLSGERFTWPRSH